MKKSSIATTVTLLGLTAGLACAAPATGNIQRDELVCVPANPNERIVLKVEMPWQKLRVTGSDIKEVRATASYPKSAREATSRTSVEGMRRLSDGAETAFQIHSRENDISMSGVGKYQWVAELDIKVPSNTRLILRAQSGGDIEVENVTGDVEVINVMGGGVVLRNVTGATTVEALDGDIEAVYKALPELPPSFNTRGGEIVLNLPSSAKSTLKLRAHTGAIYTDFGADALRVVEDTSPKDWAARQRELELKTGAGRVATATVGGSGGVKAVTTAETQSGEQVRAAMEVAARSQAMQADLARYRRAQNSVYVSGGRKIAYSLNGGGVEILAATISGGITVRQGQ